MRILMLTIALVAMTAPAFASCGGNHDATASKSTSSSVASTGSSNGSASTRSSGS